MCGLKFRNLGFLLLMPLSLLVCGQAPTSSSGYEEACGGQKNCRFISEPTVRIASDGSGLFGEMGGGDSRCMSAEGRQIKLELTVQKGDSRMVVRPRVSSGSDKVSREEIGCLERKLSHLFDRKRRASHGEGPLRELGEPDEHQGRWTIPWHFEVQVRPGCHDTEHHFCDPGRGRSLALEWSHDEIGTANNSRYENSLMQRASHCLSDLEFRDGELERQVSIDVEFRRDESAVFEGAASLDRSSDDRLTEEQAQCIAKSTHRLRQIEGVDDDDGLHLRWTIAIPNPLRCDCRERAPHNERVQPQSL